MSKYCKACNIELVKKYFESKKTWESRFYCSVKCGASARISKVLKMCAHCKNDFYAPKCRDEIARYCSQKCSNEDPIKAKAKSDKFKIMFSDRKGFYYKGYKHSEEAKQKMSINKIGISVNKKPDVFINCLRCGKEKRIIPAEIGRAKFCSRDCCRIYNDKGKVSETARIRGSLEYKNWRLQVFGRDRYTCQWCFVKGGFLHADHIKPFFAHPELRFDINNGRTLCKECHKKTDTYGVRARNYVPA
jgi:hypothetical protein